MSSQPIEVSAYEARERAQTDLNFFAALLVPEITTKPYPLYYCWLWQMLTTLDLDLEKVFRFALGLPRNHAKTMFIKLLVCYCILYHKCIFILLVCSTEPLAHNMLEDIDSMLSGETVQEIWGNWKLGLVRDTKGLKRGVFNGNAVVIAALGAGTSLRGINIANMRPDAIIMDDMQTRENALSKADRSSLLSWLFATLLKARDQNRCLIVFIGNMYNQECILNSLKNHPQWQSFITGAILQDGEPLWPEMFTLKQLYDEYTHDSAVGLGEVWFAEVMNLPLGGAYSLLPEGTIPPSPILDTELPIAQFLTIDPAGYRQNSDDNVIVRHAIYPPNHYKVETIIAGVFTPGQVVEKALTLCAEFDIRIIGIETVGYQQSLQWYFEQQINHYNRQIQVIELKPSRRAKTGRIRTFAQALLEGTYSLSKEAKEQYLFQALAFRMDKTDNKDDILDACAYGIDIRNEYHQYLVSLYELSLESETNNNVVHVLPNNSFLDKDSSLWQ